MWFHKTLRNAVRAIRGKSADAVRAKSADTIRPKSADAIWAESADKGWKAPVEILWRGFARRISREERAEAETAEKEKSGK